jgi:hypothetical protein
MIESGFDEDEDGIRSTEKERSLAGMESEKRDCSGLAGRSQQMPLVAGARALVVTDWCEMPDTVGGKGLVTGRCEGGEC